MNDTLPFLPCSPLLSSLLLSSPLSSSPLLCSPLLSSLLLSSPLLSSPLLTHHSLGIFTLLTHQSLGIWPCSPSYCIWYYTSVVIHHRDSYCVLTPHTRLSGPDCLSDRRGHSLGHIDTCDTHRVCLHVTLTGGHLGSFTHDTPAWQTPYRHPTTGSATVVLTVGLKASRPALHRSEERRVGKECRSR